MWVYKLTLLILAVMLTFFEVKSDQLATSRVQEEDNVLQTAEAMNKGFGNRKRLDPKLQFRDIRAAWTLADPELMVKNNKLQVTLQGPPKLKRVWFYMSINEGFSSFKDAEYKLKLKCNGVKLCRRRGGPVLNPGDVIHYGMAAKVKGTKGKLKFLGRTWLPFPVSTVHPTSSTGTPIPVSCSILSGTVPNGCTENIYTVPSGFPTTATGRRNPERGFYKYTEAKSSSWDPVENMPLQTWVNEGYTLIYRIFVLDTFINTNISDVILQKIQEDFATIRNIALKVIVRFCYSIDIDVIDDAPPLQLKKHLEQLSPILQENADVICLMHTGLIGVWGEWYYTANYGNEGNIEPQDYENRRQVVFQLLEALPVSRQIELRTPKYKRTILERDSSITSEEAYTDAMVARIGHHNDCFLASDDDFGTYVNKKEEYPYLQNETLYVSQGGETCNPNSPRSDCPTALKELSELHFTYLNSDYHPAVLISWKDQGCYNEVDLSLGYRLVGVLSRLPEAVFVGSSTSVGVRVSNIGWAAPINYRSAQLVLHHTTAAEEHISPLQCNLDIRHWVPGDHDFNLTLVVPSSASPGQYKVLLRLPDGEGSLQDTPEYNILMENLKDEEDLDSRLNLLGSIFVI